MKKREIRNEVKKQVKYEITIYVLIDSSHNSYYHSWNTSLDVDERTWDNSFRHNYNQGKMYFQHKQMLLEKPFPKTLDD